MHQLCQKLIFIDLALLIFCVHYLKGARGESNIFKSKTQQTLPTRPLRLPNTTFPLHYHVHIGTNIHMEQLTYTANVTIEIKVIESTNEIILHSKNLNNFTLNVQDLQTGEIIDDLTYTLEPRSSFLIIHPIENYQAFEVGQKLRVEISFEAKMYGKTNGIYWLTYNDANNRTIYLAATQFEPTSARLAFPCYDEPAYKANFTISITHGKSYMAISNMHVKDLTDFRDGDQQLTTTTFHTTPAISTYLVAFVVSDFKYIAESRGGVTHRVFTAPNSKDEGYSALRTAVNTVAELEDYFDIKYSLTKLDHIALKKNYGAAMENWGLITYKEDSLIDRDAVDIHKKLKDILTQNHEIVHQWFGNLVSPAWWTYAWLNEGFATYFSYVITDRIYPEYKAMDFFLTDIAERAYSFGYITVRPMTYYVETESEIMSIFDIITYQRAACIIKMFHHAFNQDIFVHGIRQFLKKFQYTVATEMDLFDSMQDAVRASPKVNQLPWSESVSDIMKSWTNSEWIPIVSIIRNYHNDTITIRQRSKDSYSREHWWIPFNFATSSKANFDRTTVEYFMPPIPEITLAISDLGLQLDNNDWLIANVQQTGFYHVLYDDENLMRIARTLQRNHTVIHPLNRAAIFQDLGPLIETNEVKSIDCILELLKYLQFEEDFVPWNQVADTVEFLDKNLYGTASEMLYKQFVRILIAPIFHKLFNPSELRRPTNTEMLTKQKVMDMACMADLPECLDYTRNLAHDYIFRNKVLHTDSDYYSLHDSILCLGVKNLNNEEFGDIMSILSHSQRNSLFYDDLIYSLRCTQNREHLRYYLNLLMGQNSTHNIMNDSESMMYLFYIYKANMAARPVMWTFFERNYKLLCRSPYFVDNFNRMAEYIPEVHHERFVKLHRDVAEELKVIGKDADKIIPIDSPRIGKKVKMSEIFRKKFGLDIHDWLMQTQSQRQLEAPKVHAATFGAKSNAHRFGNIFILRPAKALAKKIFSWNFGSSFKFISQYVG